MVRVNRFCVMATLQAARAHLLGLNLEEAYSWGLNRAIFFAAAKRGFKGGGQRTREIKTANRKDKRGRPDVFMLGDDMAFKELNDWKMRFTIGGKPQTSEDLRRQIVSRFGGRFEEAWKEAMRIVQKEERSALLSQSRFYNEVYRPRRDLLVEKWTKLLEPSPSATSRKGSRNNHSPGPGPQSPLVPLIHCPR